MKGLEREIQEKVAIKDNPFAIFDFDNTCIVNDIGEATFAYICRNELLKNSEKEFKTYYELYNTGRVKEAYILNARMFRGLSPEQAADVTRATIKEEGEILGRSNLFGITIAHGLTLRPQVIDLMDYLRSLGVRIWVVSASNEISVRVAMEHFGINVDLVGVRGVIKDGVISEELELPMPIIEGKVECMKKYIHPSDSPLLVVDDSITGLPILETADIKVVINRSNALTEVAQKRGWHLI